MTNDARHSPEEFVRKLWRLGFQASLGEVLTAGAAVQFSLAGRLDGGAAFVIGSRALVEHGAEAGVRGVHPPGVAPPAGGRGVPPPARVDYPAAGHGSPAPLR